MKQLKEVLEIIANTDINKKVFEINLVESCGYVLAEDIYSDINMPPFDKSAMDGYACRKSDIKEPLEILEFIGAGTFPTQKVTQGTCSKIMTGAKLPEGVDCVLIIEHTSLTEDGKVIFKKENSKENICYLGEDVKNGDKVLEKGTKITPAVIAVAASVGKTKLHVFAPPGITLIATGDELIEPNNVPNGPFIRNSNSYNIQSQITSTPAKVNYLGIIGDNKQKLKKAIYKALEKTDILILTGGVSMGDKDYVPDILREHGLKMEFDKIAIQPGKPVAFAHGNEKYCFALSGNPVSSMLQFELIVRSFIYHFMGMEYNLPIIKAKLKSSKTRKKTDRMQFFPIELINGEAKPIEFHGSAHIAGMVKANGLAIFPIEVDKLEANSEVEVLLLN